MVTSQWGAIYVLVVTAWIGEVFFVVRALLLAHVPHGVVGLVLGRLLMRRLVVSFFRRVGRPEPGRALVVEVIHALLDHLVDLVPDVVDLVFPVEVPLHEVVSFHKAVQLVLELLVLYL